ncbi:hypothetical protein ACFSTI_03340 [Rhizorhabdus histidinilytica]
MGLTEGAAGLRLRAGRIGQVLDQFGCPGCEIVQPGEQRIDAGGAGPGAQVEAAPLQFRQQAGGAGAGTAVGKGRNP